MPPETSVRIYYHTLRNSPEDRSSHFYIYLTQQPALHLRFCPTLY